MYSFLKHGRWPAFLLLGLVGAIGMPALGFWQIGRYHDRQAINKVITGKAIISPMPLRDALADNATVAEGATHEWQRISGTGAYDTDHQVLIDLRSYKGHPGYHVVTPFRFDDGRSVLVNRGWVPQEATVDGPRPNPTAESGPVGIMARIRASQVRGNLGPKDPTGTLSVFTRVDVERISQQIPYRLAPVYLELIAQNPAPSNDIALIEETALDTGTNISYAVQWFLFTLVGLITWPIIIRREAFKQKRANS